MRKNIFNIIENNKLDIRREYYRIAKLIENDIFYRDMYGLQSLTLYEYLNNNYFAKWPYRNRALSLGDYLSSIGIRNIDSKELNEYTIENLLLYIEVILNLIHFSKIKKNLIDKHNSYIDENIYNILMENIEDIFESLNYCIRALKDGRVIITEKDSIATNVAENNPDIADNIIEYRKYSLKGDITTKRKILNNLASDVESKLNLLKGTSYKELASDVGYLLNNYNIRHNNYDGIYKKDYMNNIDNNELEQIYDLTYELVLAVYTSEKYISCKQKISILKQKYLDTKNK